MNEMFPPIEQGRSIPKIIHQTWHTRDLPPELAHNIANLKAMNPTWEHKFYDAAAMKAFIVQEYSPRLLGYFERIDERYRAARSDLFRYLLLYRRGGVYLDMKSTTDRPLDSVLLDTDTFVLSGWPSNDPHMQGWGQEHPELTKHGLDEFQQWFIMAAPGHPYLKAIIDQVVANIDRYLPARHGVGSYGVVRLTGPVPYSATIHRLGFGHQHRRVADHTELGLRYSIYANAQQHRTVVGAHYSTLKGSIVELSNAARAKDVAFRIIRAIVKLVRR
jgi:hypothetical protein